MKILIAFNISAKEIIVVQAEKGMNKEECFHYSEPIFTEKFFAQFCSLMSDYVKREPATKGKSAYVVLPNESVGFETFDLPNMSRFKMNQAFEAELNNLYEGRQKTRKINKFLIRKVNDYATYGAFLIDASIPENINKMLVSARLLPAGITYTGNALLNSVYAYMPKTRGKSFVFADIGTERTEIALSVHGKTLGYASVPHGSKLLEAREVLSEYMITDHEAGALAVINARESARDKALTIYADETDTDDEESSEISDSEANQGSAGTYGSEQGAAKVKVFRKKPKFYPKYMLRPVPETEADVKYENFRILQKWILLYARQMRLTEYAVPPEYILVNIPRKYYDLLEKANAEQADGLKFMPFMATDNLVIVKDRLSLFGALYSKKFNRDGNF